LGDRRLRTRAATEPACRCRRPQPRGSLKIAGGQAMTPTWRLRLSISGFIGFIGCIIGLALDAKTMAGSYLAAWIAVSAIAIGAIPVLFTTYFVRAGWTRDLFVPLSGAALSLPIVAVLFVPVLFSMTLIYPWAAHMGDLPGFKAAYLTPWFFVLRTTVYFTIWIAIAVWGAVAYGDEIAMRRAGSVGLIVWALTASWAGIDWVESIEPHFHSSVYGLIVIAFDLLAGLSFAIAVLLIFRRRPSLDTASYSGVLLSALLLWAYLHAMQYIVI